MKHPANDLSPAFRVKPDPAHVDASRLRSCKDTALIALIWAAIGGVAAVNAHGDNTAHLGLALFTWAGAAAITATAAAGFIIPTISWRQIRYELDNNTLTIRVGVIRRHVRSVPIRRIQHTDISRDFVERMFGLATLVVYTAGTTGASVPLAGLAHEDAKILRDRILERRRAAR